MSQEKELIRLILENPSFPIQFMYPSDGGSSDYAYTAGEIKNCKIDKIWDDGDGRLWILSEDEDELLEYFEDLAFYSLYPDIYTNKYIELSDEQTKKIEEVTNAEFNSIEWKEVIVVYID